MRSGLKQLATWLLVVLATGAAKATNPELYAAIDRNDTARLAALLESEPPESQAAARVLNYAALAGDDRGVQTLLAHGVPASPEAVHAAGDGTDPRSGYGGHLLAAGYLRSAIQDPAIAKVDFRKLKIVEGGEGGSFKETYKPPMPKLDSSQEMIGIIVKATMVELIQFCNHEALAKVLEAGQVTPAGVTIGLEAAARYGEDQSVRLLLKYCREHRDVHVSWDRLVDLASRPDPEEAGSGGHPLLGLYIRSVQKSHGALAEKPISSLRFQVR